MRLVNDSGRPIAEVARDIGVNEGTLGNWVNLWRSEHAGEEPPLGIFERAELAQLRRDNQTLRMQREVPEKQSVATAVDTVGAPGWLVLAGVLLMGTGVLVLRQRRSAHAPD